MGSCIRKTTPIKINKTEIIPSNDDQISKDIVVMNYTKTSFDNSNQTNNHNSQKQKITSDITLDFIEQNMLTTQIDNAIAEYHMSNISTKTIYLKDYLVKPLENYMLCKICNDILIKPKQCSKCNMFICSHCFDKTQDILCSHIDCSPFVNYYKTLSFILDNLMFYCFNNSNNCEELVPYDQFSYNQALQSVISLHSRCCKFQSANCTNRNCTYVGPIKEYHEHVITCPFQQSECYYCKSILKKSEVATHACFVSKSMFVRPLYFCQCGERLDWIGEQMPLNYTTSKKSVECIDVFYYKCNNCKELKCKNHFPLPISKICGCGQKLTGGIIKMCSSCNTPGGIGWSCNICCRGVEMCDECISQV